MELTQEDRIAIKWWLLKKGNYCLKGGYRNEECRFTACFKVFPEISLAHCPCNTYGIETVREHAEYALYDPNYDPFEEGAAVWHDG